MPDEYDEIEDLLNSVRSDDIVARSSFRETDTPTRSGPVSHDAAMAHAKIMEQAQGNTRAVREGFTEGGHITDISMRARPTQQFAEWDDEYGNSQRGPKYEPGEKKKQRWARQHGKAYVTPEASAKLKALKLKTDPPFAIVVRLTKDALSGLPLHVYTCGDMLPPETGFRITGGPFKTSALYVLEADLWAMVYAEYLADEMAEHFPNADETHGWVRGGEGVDERYLVKVIEKLDRMMQEG